MDIDLAEPQGAGTGRAGKRNPQERYRPAVEYPNATETREFKEWGRDDQEEPEVEVSAEQRREQIRQARLNGARARAAERGLKGKAAESDRMEVDDREIGEDRAPQGPTLSIAPIAADTDVNRPGLEGGEHAVKQGAKEGGEEREPARSLGRGKSTGRRGHGGRRGNTSKAANDTGDEATSGADDGNTTPPPKAGPSAVKVSAQDQLLLEAAARHLPMSAKRPTKKAVRFGEEAPHAKPRLRGRK